MMALTAVNLAYYQELMAGCARRSPNSRFADFAAEVRAGWARGEG
jgi:queuine tRNA-ribosyltransferase